MRRIIGVAALLLLLAALGGGWYLYRDWFGIPEPSGPGDERPPGTEGAGWDLPTPELLGDPPAMPRTAVASLTRFQRSVRYKRTDDLSWEKAQEKMPLHAKDAIRTFEQSSATVTFSANDLLEVDENSLVIIMPRTTQAAEEEFALALLSPDLLDSLEKRSPEDRQRALDEAAAARQIRISPATGSRTGNGTRRIKVKTLPDKSTSLVSLRGDLRLTAPDGKQFVLKEAMVTKLTTGGELLEPRRLPTPPSLIAPQDGANYDVARKSPRVKFSWTEVELADSYRVVVARDRRFGTIFADERVDRTSFTIGNLQPGTYYWKVKARDSGGFEGAYSAVRSIRAIEDESPPPLTILEPAEMFVSPGPTVELAGQTERGALVRVNGEQVEVAPDGTFRHVVSLKEGINLVNIEAADAIGNTEYGKRLITYKGARRSNAAAAGH